MACCPLPFSLVKSGRCQPAAFSVALPVTPHAAWVSRKMVCSASIAYAATYSYLLSRTVNVTCSCLTKDSQSRPIACARQNSHSICTCSRGAAILPQPDSRYGSFVVTNKPCRENVLAVVSDEPLELDLMQAYIRIPACYLSRTDIDDLLSKLTNLERNNWTAVPTYFDVIA